MKNSNREKQRQFGLKLLFIAIIVALVFTVWYLSEKRERQIDGPVSPVDASLEIGLSGENAVSREDRYLSEAKSIMLNNYSDINMDADFSLYQLDSLGQAVQEKDYASFWDNFLQMYGQIDVGSVTYNASDDSVWIFFKTKQDGQSTATFSFWREVKFVDSTENGRGIAKPSLLRDIIIRMPPRYQSGEVEALNEN